MVAQKYPTVSLNQAMTLQQMLNDWRTPPSPDPTSSLPAFQDAGFNPVSVLRLEPRPRSTMDNPTTYQQQVQYLIGQMNEKASMWNGQARKRTHLFTARWVPGVGNGWAIVDAEANYYVYPDPLAAGFPNLPGMTYPLGEPFGLDED